MEDQPDLSAIGVDAPTRISITDMAKREEQQIVLDRDKEFHDFSLRKQEKELGTVGRVLGSRDNAITYIVAAFALLSMVFIAVFCWGNPASAVVAIEFFKAVAFASVGFITGKSLERRDDEK